MKSLPDGVATGRPEIAILQKPTTVKMRRTVRALMVLTMLLSLASTMQAWDLFSQSFELENNLRSVFMQEPIEGQEEIRDSVRILSAFTSILALLLLVATFLVPTRYLFMLGRAKWAVPGIYRSMMLWTSILLVIEALRFLMGTALIAQDWETIRPRIWPGWETLPALALFFILRRESTKQEFQVPIYNLQPLDND